MTSLAAEIERLPELPVEDLVDRYHELYGHGPPMHRRKWLVKRVAWKMQERELGGLSGAAQRRLEQLIGEVVASLPKSQGARTPTRRDGVGTTLVREYKGRQVRVTIREDGYEHEGRLYRSLTAVAKAVTGTHWNGRLFFGLTERSRGKAAP